MSVLETIIGKKKPRFDLYDEALDLLQKFIIKSKSMAPVRQYQTQQQTVLNMYTFGAMVYFAEALGIPEEQNSLLLGAYLQRQGASQKQVEHEAKKIIHQADDPSMQWHVEIGYNAARYWHKDNDLNAPKALARLFKTMR